MDFKFSQWTVACCPVSSFLFIKEMRLFPDSTEPLYKTTNWLFVSFPHALNKVVAKNNMNILFLINSPLPNVLAQGRGAGLPA